MYGSRTLGFSCTSCVRGSLLHQIIPKKILRLISCLMWRHAIFFKNSSNNRVSYWYKKSHFGGPIFLLSSLHLRHTSDFKFLYVIYRAVHTISVWLRGLQTHLLSWCRWRGQTACSGCCEPGGGESLHHPALHHLSLSQGLGWWAEPFGSGMQRTERRLHSSPAAPSSCSETWHSQSVRRGEMFIILTRRYSLKSSGCSHKSLLLLLHHYSLKEKTYSSFQTHLCWYRWDGRPEVRWIKMRVFHHFCNNTKAKTMNYCDTLLRLLCSKAY